jgi:hypothetical protein
MIFSELVAAHKAQLGKVADRFTAFGDQDFERHLKNAARRVTYKCPRWRTATFDLVAGQSDYPAPDDLLGALLSEWGRGCARQPWDDDFAGYPPLLTPLQGANGPILRLSQAPTAAQLATWGATLTYRYLAAHEITGTRITLPDAAEPLILLAALIEAMRELATDTTVLQLQRGLAGIPTAGTPAYLYEKLCLEFEAA